MKLLKRNKTRFSYRAYKDSDERRDGYDRHTGTYDPVYAEPVEYSGCIGLPSGNSQYTFSGVTQEYTHVMLMDDMNADIREAGLIDWNGDTYQITAVRKSENVLSAALKTLATSGMEDYEEGTLYG